MNFVFCYVKYQFQRKTFGDKVIEHKKCYKKVLQTNPVALTLQLTALDICLGQVSWTTSWSKKTAETAKIAKIQDFSKIKTDVKIRFYGGLQFNILLKNLLFPHKLSFWGLFFVKNTRNWAQITNFVIFSEKNQFQRNFWGQSERA